MPTRRNIASKGVLGAHDAYASFERRLAAHAIDLVIAAGLGGVLMLYLGTFAAAAFGDNGSVFWFGLVLSLLFILGYDVYFMVAYAVFSTTVGKYLFGLRVVNGKGGGEVTPMQAIVRSLAYYLSWLPAFLPFIVVFFDEPLRRGIHDHLANTVVVRDLRRQGKGGFCVILFGFFLFVVGVAVIAFLAGMEA